MEVMSVQPGSDIRTVLQAGASAPKAAGANVAEAIVESAVAAARASTAFGFRVMVVVPC